MQDHDEHIRFHGEMYRESRSADLAEHVRWARWMLLCALLCLIPAVWLVGQGQPVTGAWVACAGLFFGGGPALLTLWL